MSVEYTIWCDECHQLCDSGSRPATYVRARAKEEGLAHRSKGRDICQECWKKGIR